MHLFVPRTLVVSTFEDVTQHSCPGTFELNDPCFSADPSIGTLATALAQARTLEGPCAKLYSDSLSVALLSRLMAAQLGAADNPIVRIGLPLWRQRRAIDFMNANLSEPITLQDIAKHTGLSRMYFAARFKEATGMSPHTFLLQRRLARAKEFLASSNYSLLDVALEVGFQSQAHFSTVFRKLTGTTPGRWRASNTQATRAQT
jgi:AraC-like DNA-binding protein